VLLSFRVANFRSFRDEQELLLLPAYDKSRPALTVAAIYGANASGKSNLLEAIGYMRRAVVESFSLWSPEGGVPQDPFAFAADAREEDSRFGVDLLLDGEKYVYGFALDDTRVTEEWLYHHPHGRRRLLFEREGKNFRFGDTLRGPKATIEEVTRSNSLFLSAAAQHGLEQIHPVYTWFNQALRPSGQASQRHRTLDILQSDDPRRSRMLTLLRAADLGVIDVRIDQDAVDREEKRLAELLGKPDPETGVNLREIVLALPGVVNLIHETSEGPVPLSMSKESKGTRTWFGLLGILTDVLDGGQTLLIDELDASIHPLLAYQFVRLFQSQEANPHGAQLIFTTHDTSLLARHKGAEILRRDEVWFTEKTRTSETRLYPLTDFKPRQGLNWERRYLGGSVGAVPFLEQEDFASALDEPRAANG
jgi:AAA15 family ATPase/GTPase